MSYGLAQTLIKAACLRPSIIQVKAVPFVAFFIRSSRTRCLLNDLFAWDEIKPRQRELGKYR